MARPFPDQFLETLLKTIRTVALLPLALFAATIAHAADGSDLEKAMVGRWITGDGQIVDLEADKALRIYPKCNEAEGWKKRGVDYLPATWAIVNGNHMQLTVSANGKSKTFDTTAEMSGDEMRLTDASGHVDVHKHYTGAWPPVCPARP
jgi:hypothetical protein